MTPFQETFSDKLLNKLGYEYIKEKIEDPDIYTKDKYIKTEKRFRDIINCGNCKEEFCDWYLYKHQLKAFNSLKDGKNIIIVAKTGSGKTEAWLFYAIYQMQKRSDFKVLAIYPTKALSNDQLYRIIKYLKCLGFNISKRNEIFIGDVIRYDGDTSKNISEKDFFNAKIIITNPDMLLLNINKFIRFRPNLIVIDELDFYESSKATALVEIVKEFFQNSQLVIISGTISNPEDFKRNIKNKNLEIIKGEFPKPSRYYYIILGKKEKIEEAYKKLENILKEKFNIKSFEEFKENFFRIYFESSISEDYQVRSLIKNTLYECLINNKEEIEKILMEYKNLKDGITLVFFPSINEAESYGRSLRVNTHHSKKSKKQREKVEKDLREGKISIVFTVKTLMQGIDIGDAKRCIHIGLPFLVKDFVQKEGRIGRRKELEYTESIIIPRFFDPRLWNGVKSLIDWLEIGSESLIYNPDNYLSKLYYLVTKLKIDPHYQYSLSEEDRNLLLLAKILKENGEIDFEKIIRFRFYEIGSNTDRIILLRGDKKEEVDRISREDVIRYYQPGCIDWQRNAMIISIEGTRDKKTRFHYHIKEIEISNLNINKFSDCIKDAIRKYREILENWGIEPNFVLDVESGKIIPKVIVGIDFPKEGFTRCTLYPITVRWYIESRKPIEEERDGKKVSEYKYEKIDLENCRVKGRHYKLTYAYIYEVNDVDYIDEGMTFLITSLRLCYGIPLDLISWYLDGNMLKVWENYPVGILERMRMGDLEINSKKLELNTFLKFLEEVKIDERFKVLFYSLFPVRGVNFEKARKKAMDLAIKLFGHSEILGKILPASIEKGDLIVDEISLRDQKYFGIIYYNLGRAEVEIVNKKEDVGKIVLQSIYTFGIKTLILNVSDEALKSLERLSEIIKINIVSLRKEVKEKIKLDLLPTDLLKKDKEGESIIQLILKVSNRLDKGNMSEKIEIMKRIFKKRAEIIKGILKYIENYTNSTN